MTSSAQGKNWSNRDIAESHEDLGSPDLALLTPLGRDTHPAVILAGFNGNSQRRLMVAGDRGRRKIQNPKAKSLN